MDRSRSLGQKKFRFYLQNASAGLIEMKYAPDGWDSSKFELKRNEKYLGLFRTISFNDLKFAKDARDYIRDVYEGQGINAEITFTVNRLGNDGIYSNYYTGRLDLSTYKINETGVTVEITDTSLTEKIKNRENTKVNIRQRISIEGYEVPVFTDEFPQIILPQFEIRKYANWTVNTPAGSFILTHYIPMLLVSSDLNEAQSQTISGTDVCFTASEQERPVTITGSINGRMIAGSPVALLRITVRMFVNGAEQSSWMEETDVPATEYNFNIDINETFDLNSGAEIYFDAVVYDPGASVRTIYDDLTIQLEQFYEDLPQRTIYAYPYYEALLRICQLIADKNDIFKSEFFGRTDTPIVTYAADGQLGHITRGLFVRGTWTLNPTVPLSLSETYQALSSCFCLGMGVEDVSGTDKVVIEDLRYFFDDNVVCDISALIREDAIEKEVDAKRHYSGIKTGYNNYNYEAVGGLSEYNTGSEFTSVIYVLDNMLDIVCKFRADTQGINKLRKVWNTNEDQEGDDHIFLIDSVRDGITWLARTGEDFAEVTGGIDADMWYNLLLTPARNLLRWGAVIRSGLEKNLGTYLRWQKSDKNTTLSTRLTTETDAVVENADILVNDLTEPFYLPEIYNTECELRYSDISAILTNPKGLVKLSDTKYGWILSMVMGSEENKATFTLLRANLNVVTPVEL